jgi:hypothetical protein
MLYPKTSLNAVYCTQKIKIYILGHPPRAVFTCVVRCQVLTWYILQYIPCQDLTPLLDTSSPCHLKVSCQTVLYVNIKFYERGAEARIDLSREKIGENRSLKYCI